MDKERLPFDSSHIPNVTMKDVIGKDILCDDGKKHLVTKIEASQKFGYAVVNDESLVSLLSIVEQVSGTEVPQEYKDEFNKIADSFSIQYQKDEGKNPWNSSKQNRKQRRSKKHRL